MGWNEWGGGRETSIIITRAIYTTATNCGPPVACGRFIVLSIREWGGTRHVGERSDIPADGGGGVEVTNATSTHDIHSCEFHFVTTSTPNSNFHFHYFLLYSFESILSLQFASAVIVYGACLAHPRSLTTSHNAQHKRFASGNFWPYLHVIL